eukprot:gene4938-2371_t
MDEASAIATIGAQARLQENGAVGQEGFEGPEKRLELDLRVQDGKTGSMRNASRDFWNGVMDVLSAKIVDHIKNDHLDAYILTESSLFVSDQ